MDNNCNGCVHRNKKYTNKQEYCKGCCNYCGENDKPDKYDLDIDLE